MTSGDRERDGGSSEQSDEPHDPPRGRNSFCTGQRDDAQDRGDRAAGHGDLAGGAVRCDPYGGVSVNARDVEAQGPALRAPSE